MPTYILSVVVTTEEDYTKKRVREALISELHTADGGLLGMPELGSVIDNDRIFVRRDVDKQ
jgi:hypothetical protein